MLKIEAQVTNMETNNQIVGNNKGKAVLNHFLEVSAGNQAH